VWIGGELLWEDDLSDVAVFLGFGDGEDSLSVFGEFNICCLLICEFTGISLSFEICMEEQVLVESFGVKIVVIGMFPELMYDIWEWYLAFPMFWSWWEFEIPDGLVVCSEEHFDCLPFVFYCMGAGVFLCKPVADVLQEVGLVGVPEVYWVWVCFHVSEVAEVFVDGDGFEVLDSASVDGDVFEGTLVWVEVYRVIFWYVQPGYHIQVKFFHISIFPRVPDWGVCVWRYEILHN